jgi:hypothetical protein
MAPMPVPPESGGDDDVRARPQGLRLSDAEGIAADRLDGAAEGSLQEALAVAEADKAGYAAPHPADGIGAVGEGYARGLESRSTPSVPCRRPRCWTSG